MVDVVAPESLDQRLKRFETAKDKRWLWQSEFSQAYRWFMPDRLPLIDDQNQYYISSTPQQRGQSRVKHIFDPVGIESLQAFANNILTSMMPPYQQWAQISVGDNIENLPRIYHERFGPITDTTIKSIKDQLEDINAILFTYFEHSKLSTVLYESFLDLGISMGVLLVNRGTLERPIIYDAIPANQVIVDGDPYGEISNVWRPITISARNIKDKWPNAKFNSMLQNIMDSNPDQTIQLIESTLTYPNNPVGQKYYYSLMHEDSKFELITEWMDYFPWIVFRGQKSPGELYGRGPALLALPFVREVNDLREYLVRGLQMQAYPTFIASSSMMNINPYTLKIEPGAIIEAAPGTKPSDAIVSLTGASGQFPFDVLQTMRQEIREMMFANPIVPNNKVDTATEAQIINASWVKKNSGFFSRLSLELIPPLVEKTLHILTQQGVLPKLDINGQKVTVNIDNLMLKLDYTTPIALIQNQEKLQNIQLAVQFAMQTFGGIEGLLSLNIGELPEEVYELLDIPANLINGDFKNSPLIQQIQNAVNGTQNQQQLAQPILNGNANQPTQPPQNPLAQFQQ